MKSIKSKIVTAVVLASMMVCGSTAVFAADSTRTTKTTSVAQHKYRNNDFINKLDSLVTAGTITADQETAVVVALTSSK